MSTLKFNVMFLAIMFVLNQPNLAEILHFWSILWHKWQKNTMIRAKFRWFNTKIITRKIKLNSMLDFIDFWTLYFRWPMWVNVCILVKGLFESEWFPWGREQMKCKKFSLVKTTLGTCFLFSIIFLIMVLG